MLFLTLPSIAELLKPNLIRSGKINLLNATSEKCSEPKSTIWTKRITASCVQNTPMMMMMMIMMMMLCLRQDDEEQHQPRSEVHRERGRRRWFPAELFQLEVQTSQHCRLCRAFTSSLFIEYAQYAAHRPSSTMDPNALGFEAGKEMGKGRKGEDKKKGKGRDPLSPK